MAHRLWFVIVLSLTMFAVPSCGNGAGRTETPTAVVKSISISPGSTTILMGKQQQFPATAFGEGGGCEGCGGLPMENNDG